MIRRKVRSITNEKIYPTWPYNPDEIFNLLQKVPFHIPYNVIFYTVKNRFKLIRAGYEETESKQLATKI